MTRHYKQEIDLDTGVVSMEEHWLDGRRHRDPKLGPAQICRDSKTGIVVEERYYWRGKLHRIEGPAEIRRTEAGVIAEELYRRHGQLHRDPKEGPAEIRRYAETGVIVTEGYYLFGRAYRDPADGPEYICRDYQTGAVISKTLTSPSAPRPRRARSKPRSAEPS